MVLPFNLESAVDIGFVALVAYTCYRSMFRAQDPVVNTTSQWKD